jgi:hypothetical protein
MKTMPNLTYQIQYLLKVFPSLYSQSRLTIAPRTSIIGFYSPFLDYYRIEVCHPSGLKVYFVSLFATHKHQARPQQPKSKISLYQEYEKLDLL